MVPGRSPAAEMPGGKIVTDVVSTESKAAGKIPMGLVLDPKAAAEAPFPQGTGNSQTMDHCQDLARSPSRVVLGVPDLGTRERRRCRGELGKHPGKDSVNLARQHLPERLAFPFPLGSESNEESLVRWREESSQPRASAQDLEKNAPNRTADLEAS